MLRKGGAVAWAAVGSVLLSGCEFNGWYDVQLPGGAAAGGEDEGPKVWTPAWQLGLPLGHLAIHLF